MKHRYARIDAKIGSATASWRLGPRRHDWILRENIQKTCQDGVHSWAFARARLGSVSDPVARPGFEASDADCHILWCAS
eukprot:10180677-Lingulodinium_polyedra.AAC.1